MTLVMKVLPPHGNIISDRVQDSHFDTETGGPVARMLRENGSTVFTSGWVTINVPRGGSLILAYVEDES